MSFTGIAFAPSSDEPLYRQLFDQIVARIRSGTFPAGYRLPRWKRPALSVRLWEGEPSWWLRRRRRPAWKARTRMLEQACPGPR